MEAYLKKLLSEEEYEKEFGQAHEVDLVSRHNDTSTSQTIMESERLDLLHPTPNLMPKSVSDELDEITRSMSALDIVFDNPRRCFGQSSGASLVISAMNVKNEVSEEVHDIHLSKPFTFNFEFPWERMQQCDCEPPIYTFPPDGLLWELITLYFDYYNTYICILHRPTFIRQVAAGLHLSDRAFGANVLVVCALGACYSKDPRVLLVEYDSPYTRGWKWYSQIQLFHDSILWKELGIFDLQFYALASLFLRATTSVRAGWALLGHGIRLGQDVGADRRRDGPITVENELWKRAWWALVVQDRIAAVSLGRQPAVKDDDFDLDLPVDCDDEYWEHMDPNLAFKQPAKKPSAATAFIETIKLIQILGTALRSLYCPIKRNLPTAPGLLREGQDMRHALEDLDSALNSWSHLLPAHLQWNPDRTPDVHLLQSARIQSLCYFVRMTIHRPFIPLPGKAPIFPSVPSLTICTNAARSCITMLDIATRQPEGLSPWDVAYTFTSAVILLLSAWSVRRMDHPITIQDLEIIGKAKRVIAASADYWRIAAVTLETLDQLTIMNKNFTPDDMGPRGQKRSWKEDVTQLGSFTQGSLPTPPTFSDNLHSSDLLAPSDMLPEFHGTQHFNSFASFGSNDVSTTFNYDPSLWNSFPGGYYAAPDGWTDFLTAFAEFQESIPQPEGFPHT